jgi:hypothetical protein
MRWGPSSWRSRREGQRPRSERLASPFRWQNQTLADGKRITGEQQIGNRCQEMGDTLLGGNPAGCGRLPEHPTFDRHCPFGVEVLVAHPDGDQLALVSPFLETNCFCRGGCPPAVPLGTDHIHTGLIDSLRRSLSDFVHRNCGHPITIPLGERCGLGETSPGKTTGSATAYEHHEPIQSDEADLLEGSPPPDPQLPGS